MFFDNYFISILISRATSANIRLKLDLIFLMGWVIILLVYIARIVAISMEIIILTIIITDCTVKARL